MASVRMTQELRTKIRWRVERAANKFKETLSLTSEDYERINGWVKENYVQPEIERAQAFLEDLRNSLRPVLAKTITEESEIEKRLQQIQSSATTSLSNTYRSPEIKVRARLNEPENGEKQQYVSLKLCHLELACLKTNAPVLDGEWGGTLRGEQRIMDVDHVFPDIAEKLVESHRYSREQAAHMKEVRELLDECNTVKQLLDAWPESKALLPNDVIERMQERAPTQKRTRKEINAAGDGLRRMTGLAASLDALDQ